MKGHFQVHIENGHVQPFEQDCIIISEEVYDLIIVFLSETTNEDGISIFAH